MLVVIRLPKVFSINLGGLLFLTFLSKNFINFVASSRFERMISILNSPVPVNGAAKIITLFNFTTRLRKYFLQIKAFFLPSLLLA